MAHIHRFAEIGETTGAEEALIAACKAGEPCKLGDGERPEASDDSRRVRAELLRYLLLGGCAECGVSDGVRLTGAYVSGQLDLRFRRVDCQIGLWNCQFEAAPQFRQTRLELLSLAGSAVPGLNAEGIDVKGSVVLSDGFHATGEVSLSGGVIGGQLDCVKGRFHNPNGHALSAQGIDVKDGVFLSGGFHATGAVHLPGAVIGGQLACAKGRFHNPNGHALNAQGIDVKNSVFLGERFHATGAVDLASAVIRGQLVCFRGEFDNPDGYALIAQKMCVEEGLIWRDVTVSAGTANFESAHVGDLVDDPDCWPDAGRLILDGFTYDRISGASPTDARTRLAWLQRGTRWQGQFFPQPYVHLAKVLRRMGHDRDARAVLIEMRRRKSRHERQRAHAVLDGSWHAGFASLGADLSRLWSIVLHWSVGYGLKPVRSVVLLFGLFTVATLLADRTWQEGSFAPNSGPIITSSAWQRIAADPGITNPAKTWSAKGAPGQDWESFNRYAYGADMVIPIVDFGQTSAWAPSTTRGGWGWNLWWARWVLGALGWIVSALGAAAVTGIIRRE